MPKVICACSYIKSQKHALNDVEYIATKEEAEAAEFENLNPEIYIDYMAERPGTEYFENMSHGLFTIGGAANLEEAKEEIIKNEKSYKWSVIVSLTREDAEKVGYDKRKSWENLLQAKAPEISKLYNIPQEHFKIYAAFHNKDHHPHMHLLFFSNQNSKSEGFVKGGKNGMKKASDKLKSIFTNEIFQDEMNALKIQKAENLKNLKQELNTLTLKIGQKNYNIEDTVLEKEKQAQTALKRYSGRAFYGFLSPVQKRSIDELLQAFIDTDPNIRNLYNQAIENQKAFIEKYSDDKIINDKKLDYFKENLLHPKKKDFSGLHNILLQSVLQKNRTEEQKVKTVKRKAENQKYSARLAVNSLARGFSQFLISQAAAASSNIQKSPQTKKINHIPKMIAKTKLHKKQKFNNYDR